MRTNYLLIDYENVQPKSLELLNGLPFRVLVFVGAKQPKVPVELAAAMQSLGQAAEYVTIGASGRNALDFHIAYTLGQLSKSDPEACFHVISKDTGYDPLLQHLQSQGLWARRAEQIADIPLLKIAGAASTSERLACIVENLKSRGDARPRKVKTLSSTINALFQKSLQACELDKLVQALVREGHITVDGETVAYHLPQG